MKLSREFWFVVVVLLGMLGLVYLGDTLRTWLSREQIAWLVWLPAGIALLVDAILVVILYRSARGLLLPMLKKQMVIVSIWLLAWGSVIALIILQNSARHPELLWTRINTSLVVIYLSGLTLLMLAKKWLTRDRKIWSIIVGVSTLVSTIVVYWLNTL